MKTSRDMTNEELTKWLERFCESMDAFNVATANIREAIARLLWQEIDNARLRAKLKVAEDALESAWMYADKLPHQWPLPERVRTKMRNALAAIREEGENGNDK